MTNTEASDRSSLLALIGPLPEQPQTPEAPTPWEVDLENTESIVDATGRFLFDVPHQGIADLVVKLVNAAAAEQRAVEYYVDEDGSRWAAASNGRYYLASSSAAADEKVATIDWATEDHGCTLGFIVERYNATPVYKT